MRDGLALSDVAIFARDLEPYRPFWDETADEFGIPLRVVGGLPLVENPAVAALLALLGLSVDNWPHRGVMEAWASPYFEFPGRDEAPWLDEISRAAKVVKGLAQWREAFSTAKNRQEVEDPETDSHSPRFSNIQSLEALESRFNEFIDLLMPPERASAREFVAFIEQIIGEEMVAYADFFSDLRGAVETASFSQPAQSGEAPRMGVLVASALDGRGLSFQVVASSKKVASPGPVKIRPMLIPPCNLWSSARLSISWKPSASWNVNLSLIEAGAMNSPVWFPFG